MSQEITSLASYPIPDESVDYIDSTTADYSAKTGRANAYQAVIQAASQAVQDARASLQNTSSIASATEAVMEKLIAQYLAAQDYENAAKVSAFLTEFLGPTGPVAMKATSLAQIGTIAKTIAEDFPSGAS